MMWIYAVVTLAVAIGGSVGALILPNSIPYLMIDETDPELSFYRAVFAMSDTRESLTLAIMLGVAPVVIVAIIREGDCSSSRRTRTEGYRCRQW